MRLTRRNFGLAALSAPLVAPATALPALADGHASAPQAAVFDATLGRYKITAIMDGMAPLARPFFFGPDAAEIDAVLADAGTPGEALPAPVNAYLLTSDDRTILIDAGMGEIDILGPGFGRLGAGLAAAGTSAEAIDTLIVTHLHPDHVGGMLAGGAPVFPNAEIVVAEAEAGFWTDPAMLAAAPAEAKGLFQLASGVVGAYGDQVTRVADGAEVAPGITLNLAPGHTPGHSVLRIDGGDRQMMMIADVIHNTDLHTALPMIGFGFDVDSALAGQSRVKLFDMLSADNMLIAGSHVHFPGFGRILKSGEAYRYAPASWM